MFPIEIPPGTSSDELFTKVLPDLHGQLVTDNVPSDPIAAFVRVEGGKSYRVSICGKKLCCTEGAFGGEPLWMTFPLDAVTAFLDDWTGEKRFAPRYVPKTGLVAFTDPRILKRVVMVSGRVELALADFPTANGTRRLRMTIGVGDAAKRGVVIEDPDTTIEIRASTLERLVSGRLSPENALADNDVTLRGKRIIAMQLAFAVGPFFAPPG